MHINGFKQLAKMSLIPLENSITGAMPVIFFEAQIHGQSQKILMEIGLSLDTDQCSVALLSEYFIILSLFFFLSKF